MKHHDVPDPHGSPATPKPERLISITATRVGGDIRVTIDYPASPLPDGSSLARAAQALADLLVCCRQGS